MKLNSMCIMNAYMHKLVNTYNYLLTCAARGPTKPLTDVAVDHTRSGQHPVLHLAPRDPGPSYGSDGFNPQK